MSNADYEAIVPEEPVAPAGPSYEIRNDDDVQLATNPDKSFFSGEIIIIIVLVVILICGVVFFLQRRKQQQAENVPTTEVEADLRDAEEKAEE